MSRSPVASTVATRHERGVAYQARIRLSPPSSVPTSPRSGRFGTPTLPRLSTYPWYGWSAEARIRARSGPATPATRGAGRAPTRAGTRQSAMTPPRTSAQRRRVLRRTTLTCPTVGPSRASDEPSPLRALREVPDRQGPGPADRRAARRTARELPRQPAQRGLPGWAVRGRLFRPADLVTGCGGPRPAAATGCSTVELSGGRGVSGADSGNPLDHRSRSVS